MNLIVEGDVKGVLFTPNSSIYLNENFGGIFILYFLFFLMLLEVLKLLEISMVNAPNLEEKVFNIDIFGFFGRMLVKNNSIINNLIAIINTNLKSPYSFSLFYFDGFANIDSIILG